MIVLALDIATNTGVAVGRVKETPRAWSVDLGAGQSQAYRLARVLDLTRGLIDENRPDAIFVEAAVGGPKTSHFLVGLLACVTGQARLLGLDVQTCAIGTVRKHFLGRSWAKSDFPGLSVGAAARAIKGKVMGQCALLRWDVADDDAADAAAVWDYGCSTLSRAHQMHTLGGLFNAT